jgi:hypothetical protein
MVFETVLQTVVSLAYYSVAPLAVWWAQQKVDDSVDETEILKAALLDHELVAVTELAKVYQLVSSLVVEWVEY